MGLGSVLDPRCLEKATKKERRAATAFFRKRLTPRHTPRVTLALRGRWLGQAGVR